MDRVFLTGSNGFIGKAIARELLRLNYEVTGSGRGENLNDGIDYCRFDISSDYYDCAPGKAFDVLIHAAARSPIHGGSF